MQTVAYYATLDNDNHGVALRTADGSVHFQAETTGLWTQLTNADAPRLTLNGRVDLADAQALVDGDRVRTCSRTLVEGQLMVPRIQFRTVTTKKYTRVQWSSDHGQTWHEPEEAPIEVARAWQARQARQQEVA